MATAPLISKQYIQVPIVILIIPTLDRFVLVSVKVAPTTISSFMIPKPLPSTKIDAPVLFVIETSSATIDIITSAGISGGQVVVVDVVEVVVVVVEKPYEQGLPTKFISQVAS